MRIKALREFALYFVISIAAIFALTAIAGIAASHLSPDTTGHLQLWIKQSPANRFDDWMDGVVIANVLYKSINAKHSIWTYFEPASAPPAGWELLEYVLSATNYRALAETVKDRKGELLHRYWTGHIALTALALYMYIDPAVASRWL